MYMLCYMYNNAEFATDYLIFIYILFDAKILDEMRYNWMNGLTRSKVESRK